MSPTETVVGSYTITTRQDIHETTRQLVSHLGPTLVAILAGSKDSKLPHRWSQATGPEPRIETRKRLMAAHRAWLALSASENDYIARNWFIGANPRLDERSPAEALRAGDIAEVMAAVDAFVEGTDG
jgi:hypothetical protein